MDEHPLCRVLYLCCKQIKVEMGADTILLASMLIHYMQEGYLLVSNQNTDPNADVINNNADHSCDFTVRFIKMYAYEKIPPEKWMLNAY